MSLKPASRSLMAARIPAMPPPITAKRSGPAPLAPAPLIVTRSSRSGLPPAPRLPERVRSSRQGSAPAAGPPALARFAPETADSPLPGAVGDPRVRVLAERGQVLLLLSGGVPPCV